MLINLRSEAAEAPLTLDNASLTPPAETWLFDHAHNAEQVDSTALSETTTLNLPPESMTLLVISQR
jgi:hypothetical protein